MADPCVQPVLESDEESDARAIASYREKLEEAFDAGLPISSFCVPPGDIKEDVLFFAAARDLIRHRQEEMARKKESEARKKEELASLQREKERLQETLHYWTFQHECLKQEHTKAKEELRREKLKLYLFRMLCTLADLAVDVSDQFFH